MTLTIDYFKTLGRAHDHPPVERRSTYTDEDKIEILNEFIKGDRNAKEFNEYYNLPFGTIGTFVQQLKAGKIGNGHEELINKITNRYNQRNKVEA